jgi:dihydroxy-acid dehydratase
MQIINKFSSKITESFYLPAAKSMLYAIGLNDEDFNKPQIGIINNWYEGNPCNINLNNLSNIIKAYIHENEDVIGFQFNTIGVSDGISMGTVGMKYSLPSRELISDSIETVVIAHHYDGVIAIPGCDKNIPGVLMGLLRINRPSVIIYGGSIASGFYKGQKLDIVSSFEALGKINQITNNEYEKIIKYACTGHGSCGGMYTANTMATALEAMGMTLPYSSSYPAVSYEKVKECKEIGSVIIKLLKKNIRPKDIITNKSLENAIVLSIALGGSTNLVLHILAIAKTMGIDLNINKFKHISDKVPIIGNLKPSGRFVMEDIHSIGGIPIIMKYLLEEGLIQGDCMTITGNSIAKNLEKIPKITFKQKVIYSIYNPIKKKGHLKILYGNIATGGSVAKISVKVGNKFNGYANTFNSEYESIYAIINNKVYYGDVIVIRYVGPKGGPGMPEMLKPTSFLIGAGMGQKVSLITDGRFSGGSHGFVVGHIVPEAKKCGTISNIFNCDIISIDADNNNIHLEISNNELEFRKYKYSIDNIKLKNGYLYKYAKYVYSASDGCLTTY